MNRRRSRKCCNRTATHHIIYRLCSYAFSYDEMTMKTYYREEGVVAVMNKLVKQRKESVLSYTEGNRLDLAVAEQAECDVIYSYLPKQLTTEEVGKMITEAMAKVGATNIKDMGKVKLCCTSHIALPFHNLLLNILILLSSLNTKVMAELKPQLMGKADMTSVGNLIRQQLGGPVGKK